MADEDKGGALWRFALAVYQKPGVSDACLLLQDRHGCNVTLLLFAAWAGAERGVALTAEEFAAAGNAVRPWHGEVVKPLRAVRRRLKHGPPPAPDDGDGKTPRPASGDRDRRRANRVGDAGRFSAGAAG